MIYRDRAGGKRTFQGQRQGIGDLTDVCYAYENDNAKGDDINAASV